jgi:Fe-S-cluster-containing dehydrogenase component
MKAAAFGAGALALGPVASFAAEPRTFGPDEVGMLYDSTKCVGCKACVYACRKANFERDDSGYLSKEHLEEDRWVDDYELNYRTKNIIKMYDNPDNDEFAFIKRQCNHCNHPGCVSACPVSAMTKNPETGIVEYDKSKCVGCRYCQLACPFNVPTFEWHQPIPKIVKCEMCRETNLKEKGITACCEVCPAEAVIFGKREELLADAQARIEAEPEKYINKIYGETDYGGTNVLYLAAVDFERLGLPVLPEHSYAAETEKIQHTVYKGMIAPMALYAVLAVAVYRNGKKNNEGGH